jgi:Sister chromatid cohesion C-terminus
MGPLYSDIKTKKRFRVRYLRSLVNLLDKDSQSKENTFPIDVHFARFIVENLLYLEYGVIEEVYTVIHTVDRIISSTGVSLLQSIENGDNSTHIVVLTQRSIVLSLLIGLKQYLKMAYNLTEAKCRAFDPKKTGTAKDNKPAVRTRTVGVVDWPEIPYLDNKFEDTSQMVVQLKAVRSLLELTNTSLRPLCVVMKLQDPKKLSQHLMMNYKMHQLMTILLQLVRMAKRTLSHLKQRGRLVRNLRREKI